MYYYAVIPKVVIGVNRDILTYHFNALLEAGQIVEVSVGKKQVLAVVAELVDKPKFATKEITKVYENTVLPAHLIGIVRWLGSYYATPLATVLQTILPRGINKSRRCKSNNIVINTTHSSAHLPLNDRQKQIVHDVINTTASTTLLHGITGSGKTNIYIRLALNAKKAGQSTIVLVPEISLTSQIVKNFSAYFENIVVLHSGLSEAERHLHWQAILGSTEPLIVIGARSAIFAPVKNLGLIVVDEAHEPSYKQEQSPKYNVLRVASALGKLSGAKVLLGSASPLISDYFLAEQTDGSLLRLDESAINVAKPDVKVINSSDKRRFTRHAFLSDELIKAVDASLAGEKQVLIFHNRRGSTSYTTCSGCGWQAMCECCHIPLTLYEDRFSLICNMCGQNRKVPTHCPTCGDSDIVHRGIGTRLVEREVSKLWPKAIVACFDSDTPKARSLHINYDDIHSGKIQVLIGTQILAKGLDLPKLETVGVIQADANLAIPDFSSEERVFQLISQVVGRVGRNENHSNVIVQTYQPDNPVIQLAVKQDYAGFYRHSLAKRQRGQLPPYRHLLKLTCSYKTEAAAVRNARKIADQIKRDFAGVQVFGPAPAFYERRSDKYRWQVVVKSQKRADLLSILQHNFGPNCQFELDPSNLL